MAKSIGIQSHEVFKLGKKAVQRDQRNLKFAALLKARVAVPAEYDFDLKHRGIATPMFANDVYGCCVIAGRAHETLRFELIEQRAKLRITDKEVLQQYFKETGGPDSGLVVLESLKKWRKLGWSAAKKRYRIRAFSEVAATDHASMKRAIFLDMGIGLGLNLPKTAQNQIQTGKAWDVHAGPGSSPGSWGGHYVYVPGYTKRGPVCVTWGRKQQMTWKFIDRYCDEAYAIFDAVDTAKVKKAVDLGKLKCFLGAL